MASSATLGISSMTKSVAEEEKFAKEVRVAAVSSPRVSDMAGELKISAVAAGMGGTAWVSGSEGRLLGEAVSADACGRWMLRMEAMEGTAVKAGEPPRRLDLRWS